MGLALAMRLASTAVLAHEFQPGGKPFRLRPVHRQRLTDLRQGRFVLDPFHGFAVQTIHTPLRHDESDVGNSKTTEGSSTQGRGFSALKASWVATPERIALFPAKGRRRFREPNDS